MNLKGIQFYVTFLSQCIGMRKKIKRIAYTHEKDRVAQFQLLAREWMRNLWASFGINIEVRGYEHFPGDGKCIVVFNHQSFLDIMAATTLVPFPNKTLAKASGRNIPIFGKIWESASILVDRKKAIKHKSVRDIMRAIDDGITVIVFPEGTRNTSKLVRLLPFHDGAFEIAVKKKIPIVVGWIEGSAHVMPKGCTFHPGNVSIKFLGQIDTTDKSAVSCKKITKKMMLGH